MEIYDVKFNGWRNPIGYRMDRIICSWKVRDVLGHNQENAKIEVSTKSDFREVLYSKEGKFLNSLGEKIEIETKPCTRYFVRIVVNTDAEEIVISETQYFETGLMNEEWKAQWIGLQCDDYKNDDFYPVFNHEIMLDKSIKNARLYICGLGLFEAYIDDEKVGTDMLAPFLNDYQEHVQYCTYDITNSFERKPESNRHILKVFLGDGWYKGRYGLDGKKNKFGGEFRLIAQIIITYLDGTCKMIGTDDSWEYQRSFLDRADIYDGEIQNYLRLIEKQSIPQKAVIIKPDIKLVERYSLPLHAMEDIPVKEVIHTPAGELVLDFGQNFAGYVECNQMVPKGEKLKFEFGEILQESNFYHDNYRSAISEFVYFSDGIQRVIRPLFTFYGFRYVKVTGFQEIDPNLFTGKAMYSEMERTGLIETSEKKINKLYENTVWGLKSNFLDIPTDCPQRDERLGWTGDAQVFCRTAGYHMDTAAFFQKYLSDLRTDQVRNKGKVGAYFPNFNKEIYSAVWGDAATIIPKMLYEYYGNIDDLKENYPLMRDWVNFISEKDKEQGSHYLYDFGFQFGDWLSLDGKTEQSMIGKTDTAYIASVFYYLSACYVAEAAKVIGRNEEFKKYNNLSENIRKSILREYFTPAGRLAVDTQTGYILALKSGIYIDKQKLLKEFMKCLDRDCYRIKGGFVGAPLLCMVLAENGLIKQAYDFLFFDKYPSWLYEVNLGATTVWERWNSVLPNGKISGTGMNSLNHYSYGAVSEFLYRHVAGIQPILPGFRKVKLEPKPDARFRHFNCNYESAVGKIVSKWQILDNGDIKLEFEIPFGATAEIHLPGLDTQPEEVMSGVYEYQYKPGIDYRILYSENTRIEQLVSDKRAVELLQEIYPDLRYNMDIDDLEFASSTLQHIKNMAGITGQVPGKLDHIIKKILELKWE